MGLVWAAIAMFGAIAAYVVARYLLHWDEQGQGWAAAVVFIGVGALGVYSIFRANRGP